MTYKNSVKILLTNFSLVWKVLVYLILSGAVVVTLSYFALKDVFIKFAASGIIELFLEAYSVFMANLNLTVFLQSVGDCVVRISDWFVAIFPEIWLNVLLFVLIIGVLREVLFNFVYVPITNTINYYMGSMIKYPFINSYVGTFGLNVKYQLVHIFTLYPIKLVTTYFLVYAVRLLTLWGVFPLLSLFIMVLLFTLLTVIRVCVFNVWIPAMVTLNLGVFKGLFRGVKITLRKFLSTFSNSVVLVLTMLVVNVVAGLATFGVALLVTAPLSYMLYSIFGLVVLYDAQGLRYYVDSYNVVVSKKKDSTDKLKNVKYIV